MLIFHLLYYLFGLHTAIVSFKVCFCFQMVLFRKVTHSLRKLSSQRWLQTKVVPVSFQDVTPVFRKATEFPSESVALRDSGGDYSYRGLFLSSKQLAGEISAHVGERKQERVAFLCPNDASYIIAQWACWMSGHIGKVISIKLYKYCSFLP